MDLYADHIAAMHAQREDFLPAGFDTYGAPGPGGEALVKWLVKRNEEERDMDRSSAVAYVRQRISVGVQVSSIEMLGHLVRKAEVDTRPEVGSRVQVQVADLDEIRDS